MANMRKKRCLNPACGRVFKVSSGSVARCPFCNTVSSRTHAVDQQAMMKQFAARKVCARQLKQTLGGVMCSQKQATLPVESLDLSIRAYNCLKRAGILTVGNLVMRTEAEMMIVRNLGRKSLTEIREKLQSMGLDFKQDETDRGGCN